MKPILSNPDWQCRIEAAEQPVVSWAGPLERARQALDRASDLFERKDIDAGLDEMKKMQANVNSAIEFIVAQEAEKAREK